ncbi:hypothetical protein [Spiribacter insolitus]|uniref:Uncharacterized protein n=1 Tax=Spiribacter insolitus TaxID=3122417 RepID=A0ABV3T7Y3_9GAMM
MQWIAVLALVGLVYLLLQQAFWIMLWYLVMLMLAITGVWMLIDGSALMGAILLLMTWGVSRLLDFIKGGTQRDD